MTSLVVGCLLGCLAMQAMERSAYCALIRDSNPILGNTVTSNSVPNWSSQSELFEVQNASYLSSNVLGTKRDPLHSVPEFLEEQQIRQMTLEHQRLVRDYELKSQYGLVTRQDEQSHYDAIQNFSRSMVMMMGRNQMKSRLDRLRHAIEENPDLMLVAKPVSIVALVVAFYNGQPILTGIGKASIRARMSIPTSETEVSMNSPFLDTSFYMHSNRRTAEEMAAQALLDPIKREERIRLSAGRNTGLFGLYSGLSYGGSTQTMTASLSKQLTPALNAKVSSRTAAPDGADRGEQSLNFSYGLSF